MRERPTAARPSEGSSAGTLPIMSETMKSARSSSQQAVGRIVFSIPIFFAILYIIHLSSDAFTNPPPLAVRAALQLTTLIAFLTIGFSGQRKIIRYLEMRGQALCSDGQVCPMCGHSVAQVSGPGACSECGSSYTNYGLTRYWDAVFKSGLYDYDRIILPLKDRPDPSE